MKIHYLLFILMNIHITPANVHWKLKERNIVLGKPLNLECTLSQKNVQNVSRRWTGGLRNRLLCFNGVSTDPSKYKETEDFHNTYTLQIRETSEDDIECPYSCRFGFLSDERILHVTEDNFQYLPNENTTKIEYSLNKENYTLLLEFKKVFPEPVCRIPIKDTLRNLTKVKESKGRVFYHLTYKLESSESLHTCGRQLEIKCTIRNTVYTFYRPHDLSCTALDTPKSTIVHRINMAIAITIAALVVIMLIVCNKTIGQNNRSVNLTSPCHCSNNDEHCFKNVNYELVGYVVNIYFRKLRYINRDKHFTGAKSVFIHTKPSLTFSWLVGFIK